MSKKKFTVAQMQKLCGFLNFLGRCVVPGRAFTRRLYTYTGGKNLKPHHHVRLNAEIRADLSLWWTFLSHQSVFCRPFLDFSSRLQATEIRFFTDTSGAIGFGGICQQSWIHGLWNPHFLCTCKPNIEYLELYAELAASLCWLHRFANKRIILFCDNQAVV